MGLVAGALAVAGACTMNNQEAPPLTGPSELAQSIAISVSPDVLPQDGASQSFITVTARDANSHPIRNLTMRTETRVGGTPVDFGVLSARNVVTGSDGRATLVYTAPPSPAVSPDSFLVVDVVVTPYGSDYNNSNPRSAAIRLVPQGTVIPPVGDLVADFSVSPASLVDHQTALFDASASKGSIASYEWNFGDGERDTGRTVDHDYEAPGTYVVRLTVVDPYGRTASKAQSITVAANTQQPTAVFIFSPTAPRVGQGVNFNAAQSRAPAGATITSYSWNFGDGTAVRVTGDAATTKAYGAAGTYQVTLTVTDSLGRSTTSGATAVTIVP
jgi:PKD repeat protein